ncbi:uncharacterized protein BDV17DRAFT_285936 [Aspergillus undulatus]|uniref:uncharacterized protein n=1 Tax=Aspergillus undulatus TaxID=1810928 RepID=UPI003CCE283D
MAGAGTIIITGATSPLATAIIRLLVEEYPSYTLILTSRNTQRIKIPTPRASTSLNPSPSLNNMPLSVPGNNNTTTTTILTKRLDLSSLTSVHDFATTIATDIQIGLLPPLSGIICCAHYNGSRRRATTLRKRSMNNSYDRRDEEESTVTDDGYERIFQVNYISHVALVMRLLGNFRRDGGRVVLFGDEDGFERGNERNRSLGYFPDVPDDLNTLVDVNEGEGDLESEMEMELGSECEWEWDIPDHKQKKTKKKKEKKTTKKDHIARGVQQYTTSRQATVMWMHALNRHLEEDLALGAITAAAVNINPGIRTETGTGSRIGRGSRDLSHSDSASGALRLGLNANTNTNTSFPLSIGVITNCITRPLISLARRFLEGNTRRPRAIKTAEAATDIVCLATNTICPFEGGYFDLKDKDTLGIVRGDGSSSSWNSLDHDEGERREEALWNKTLEWAGVSDANTALKVQFEG